jgi:serine/threonine protein kinase
MESTQNFNQKIGQGGFGSVFFGKLREGRDIAVKVLSLFSIEGVHQFQNEVDLLSKIHHKNLVSLLGFCNESKEVMLIYEHMCEGSLRDHLYGPRAEISQLNWKTRLKIALDAAQGLEYLHVGCTPKIIHRDVKTANILLDRNMNGKLADFGLSRITVDGEASYANTAVKGTIGYLDPEYFRTQKLTEKSDVYSLGVVLLEMICGRPPINTNLGEEEVNLIQWVTQYVKMDDYSSENIEVIVDKRLDGNYDLVSIVEVAKLAFRCVEATPSSRPSVSELVTQIKEAIICENENNSPPPISEGIGSHLQASNVHPRAASIPRKMEWADNSSNLAQVGR